MDGVFFIPINLMSHSRSDDQETCREKATLSYLIPTVLEVANLTHFQNPYISTFPIEYSNLFLLAQDLLLLIATKE